MNIYKWGRRKELFSLVNFRGIHVAKVTEYDADKLKVTLSGYGLPASIVMKFDPDADGIKALNLSGKDLEEGDTVVVAYHQETTMGPDGRQVAGLAVVGVIGWPDE